MWAAGLELLIKVREKGHQPVPRGSSDNSHEALPGCWALPGSAIRPAAQQLLPPASLPAICLLPFPGESKLAPAPLRGRAQVRCPQEGVCADCVPTH